MIDLNQFYKFYNDLQLLLIDNKAIIFDRFCKRHNQNNT